MDFQQILYHAVQGIATITLNRRERLNAWTPVMEQEVRAAMQTAATAPDVKVIVITGAGRGFCAGMDMAQLDKVSASGTRLSISAYSSDQTLGGSARKDFQGRFTYLPSIGKPVIAAINGAVAGNAMALVLACDLRFASEDAFFTTAFSRRGLTAEHGMSWLLPRLIGPAHASDLLLSARRVSASEAYRMGLVNEVCSAETLLDRVYAYAQELIAHCSPRSLRVIKRQLWDAHFESLSEALAVADDEMRQSFLSEDFKEGVAHIREKRAPKFTGQ